MKDSHISLRVIIHRIKIANMIHCPGGILFNQHPYGK